MCGRFTLTVDADVVQQTFLLTDIPPHMPRRYNIAPSQPVLATVNDGQRRGELLLWGLIPSWAKDPTIGNRMINARAETLAEKPSFRTAFRKRRCVVYADGFYEWKKENGRKTPMYIRLHDGQPFAFAGLWEVWKPPESDEWIRSCTIVTTEPNDFMAGLHNRMPVILDQAAMDFWLTPEDLPPEALMSLLRPYEDEAAFSAYPVSPLVNNPRHDAPECVLPLTD